VSAFFASIGMPEVVAGIIAIALTAYALTGGADYGGGVWDLLAGGPRNEAQRLHIANSLAPIWEANHVWLIVAVVMVFTGFPVAFNALGIVLHIPLTLVLVGIVLRGTAFVFRSYGARSAIQRERWGLTFAVASVITPIVLGMVIGSLATGAAGAAWARVEAGKAPFVASYVWPWLSPFTFAVGLFGLALFAFLAAVYLAYGSDDRAVREDFRRRGLAAAIAVFVLAAVALVLARAEAPRIAGGLIHSAWSVPLQGFTAVAAITAIIALYRHHYGIARVAAAAQVALIVWGWVLSQYPFIIPHELTIRQAAAPRITLELLLTGLAIGGAILIPSLRYLYGVFARKAPAS
jgi:cytochrome d ubiquinol oxidase subunit II